MKVASAQKDAYIKKNWDKIIIAIAFIERRVHVLSGKLLQQMLADPNFVKSDFDSVTDEMYEMYLKENMCYDFGRQGWYRPL